MRLPERIHYCIYFTCNEWDYAVPLKTISRGRGSLATWISTQADMVANLGVILSGILVALPNSRYPDLIIGFVICLYVLKEAS